MSTDWNEEPVVRNKLQKVAKKKSGKVMAVRNEHRSVSASIKFCPGPGMKSSFPKPHHLSDSRNLRNIAAEVLFCSLLSRCPAVHLIFIHDTKCQLLSLCYIKQWTLVQDFCF